jgi:DNA-3-methyladenine glycosylase
MSPAKIEITNSHRPLPREFFARSVLKVAKECLGKLLVHEIDGATLVARIVEVEAYRGPLDRAAHSFGGRRTERTEVMFGQAGIAYVFFVYGMHCLFNVVTGKRNEPQAVLIRAVEPQNGQASMASRRGHPGDIRMLTNGPGRLCQALGIDRFHNGVDLCRPPLYFAEGPVPKNIQQSPRIGVDYAGIWAKKPWRWTDADSPFVSRRPGPKRPKTSG